jgi:CheY-like chemotaxis protein
VLIVEDQANERELLATCLRLGGVDVATAGNGREAFDYLHEHDLPDLVLLDMQMPEVDGPTFVKSVRDDIRLHNLRVFAVSGLSQSDFESNTLAIDGWFSKPVRIDALLQAVRGGHTNSMATTA